MAELSSEQALDRLLATEEPLPEDGFVLDVMLAVRRQRRLRWLILSVCGLVGAAFGLFGALLLSAPISALFQSLPLTGTMQAVLLACAACAFYVWFMNDDLTLAS